MVAVLKDYHKIELPEVNSINNFPEACLMYR